MRVRRLTAMISSVPLGLALTVGFAAEAQAASAPCGPAAKACLDLSANQAWLMNNGAVTYGPVPVTHGKPGWETPPGTFKVTRKNRHHRSSQFNNAPMPYSVFFNGGIAFHQGSLREKSHGCVHLSKSAAAKFFGTLKIGDQVQVVP
ncbi:L,D-transpeptidase [Kibdelosporangium aridum]|uniref:L,D-transpeptidase catalytic domain n=1 Tax=Kibdelosporangium aridum TaxID=2030 RepID=A0A1Y5XYE8_KIBAR|nr:L,D-transpeptidase [Kibdelosporangium aridum]SMD19028.1 L,D-transpeptidase catalytic domain [Kibdelosporangium aridum]